MEGLIRAFAGLPDDVRRRHQLVLVCRLQPLERNHFEVLGRSVGLARGELLLTGLVSDEALVHLYRSAALVVYPSRYEGYGLPVAEAMACGAPVVASGNSSLRELVDPEATFDPDDLVGMAAAIERGLVDRSFRDRLLRWSARPRSTWSEVAERAATVYRDLSTEPGGDRPRRPAAWPCRPRVALVTPWPPATTGVASYSRRLARAMAGSVDVDLFVDGDGADDGPDDPEFTSYPAAALPRVDPVQGGYEAVIACIGNSEHHAGALAVVRRDRVHAAVLAHDVRLNGLYRHGAARGAVPEGNAAVVTRLYGEASGEWVTDGWLQPPEAEEHGVYLARELIGLADPFIVTSEYAAELARLDARPEDRGRVVVCPYAYPAPVPRPPGREQPGLVATFGLVNAVKQPELLLAAFAIVGRADTTARLAFVGPIDPALLERYHALAVHLGVAEAVTFTGEVDDDGYEAWLARTSVAVQLRARTNGETSGAVADCLSHGVATVVTDLGPAHQLPDLVAKVPASTGPPELAGVVGALLDDPEERGRRATEGLAFVAGMGFDRGARDLLAAVGVAPITAGRPGPP
jgi:glycosyltransferase involved in cell wall biosynthesis